MGDWPEVRLDVLAAREKSAISKPYGSAILQSDYLLTGVPVVRGVNLAGGIFHDDDFVFISPRLADRMPGAALAPGDLVFTHRGTVGQVSMIPRFPRHATYVASTSQVKVRLDPICAVPEFYYYWFHSPRGRRSILENTSTVGVPGIAQPVATIKSLVVPCPPRDEQSAIAEVLGALDDKIAVNDIAKRGTARLARARYEGAVRAGSSHRIDEIAKLVTRGVAPKYVGSDGLIVLNQKCVRDQWVDLRPSRMTEPLRSRADRLLVRDDVLVNSTGQGTLGRVARWNRTDQVVTVDSHITIVRFDESAVDATCAGFGVLELEAQIEALAEGSTGQTELRRDLLGALQLRLPPPQAQTELGQELRHLDALSLSLRAENEQLAATRDELLPLLMSGKVRVRDAEEAVGGAG